MTPYDLLPSHVHGTVQARCLCILLCRLVTHSVLLKVILLPQLQGVWSTPDDCPTWVWICIAPRSSPWVSNVSSIGWVCLVSSVQSYSRLLHASRRATGLLVASAVLAPLSPEKVKGATKQGVSALESLCGRCCTSVCLVQSQEIQVFTFSASRLYLSAIDLECLTRQCLHTAEP